MMVAAAHLALVLSFSRDLAALDGLRIKWCEQVQCGELIRELDELRMQIALIDNILAFSEELARTI